jgi:hypothetical protein
MKLIFIIMLILIPCMTLFGTIKVNDKEVTDTIARFFISIPFSLILSLIIGLPILGIMYLIK